MNRCCPADVIVFGHVQCSLRPAWAVSEAAAEDHDIDEWAQLRQWSDQAANELRKTLRRGAEIAQNAPGHAGIPGSGPQSASGDRGAAGMAQGGGR